MRARLSLCLAPLFVLLAACQPEPQVLRLSGETMGTTYNITARDPSGELAQEAVEAAVAAALAEVDASLSNWNPGSEVSRFNAAASTEPVEISPGFTTVMAEAQAIHTASEGQFDMTLGPLIELWGFGARKPETPVPSDEAIAGALARVGQGRLLTLDASTLAKAEPEVQVYVAAIAKGYGVDRVAEALRGMGMSDYMVEIGGDLVTSGTNPEDAPWRIGIERPEEGGLEEVVALTDQGMATSGDYRNYFEQDGVRYSHILDATTGRPITHKTASVTVLADSAMRADGWATALLALGAGRGMAISEAEGLAVLFIERGPEGFVTRANAHWPAPAGKDRP